MKRKFVTRKAQGEDQANEPALRSNDLIPNSLETALQQPKVEPSEPKLQVPKGPFNTSIGLKKPLGKTSINTTISGKRVLNTKIGEVGIVTAVEKVESSPSSSCQVLFETGSDFINCSFDARNLASQGRVTNEASQAKLDRLRRSLRWKIDIPRKFMQGVNFKEILSRFEEVN